MNSRFSILIAEPFRTVRRRSAMLSLLLVLLLTASACDLLGTFVVIENRTSQELQVVTVISEDDTVVSAETIGPGRDWQSRGECTGDLSDMVIQDVSGNELLRHEGAFCTDDSPWTITDEMISTND